MNAFIRRRDRRARLVERRLAGRADDLGLEIGLARRARATAAPREPSRRARALRDRPRGAGSLRLAECGLNALGVGRLVALDVDPALDPLSDEPPVTIDEERLGEARHAPLAERRAFAVVARSDR